MKQQLNHPQTPHFLAYAVYALVALFLFYEMALQVSPSVITTELMGDLHINASWLGIISGVYFYSYMLMQIPSGMLFDRYETRMLIPSAILICVLGTLFFAMSETISQAVLGRFLMGIGSSCAFISVLVVSTRWFPASYFALLVGIAQLLAAAGALGGEAPLALFIHALGWRHAFYWLIAVGIILAAVIWKILKNEPILFRAGQTVAEEQGIRKSLMTVLTTSQTWWIALYAFCGWGPIATFASLWGVPYLMNVYHINSAEAAIAIAMIWIGLMIGSPLFGWYSTRLGRRVIFLRLCALLGLVIAVLVIYIPNIPFWLMSILLLGFGIATAGHILTFALAKENHDAHLSATVIGFNNMAVVAGGAIFQPLVGVILHLNWAGQSSHGTPIYTVSDYRIALSIVPLCFLVGLLTSLFCIRETYCHNKETPE